MTKKEKVDVILDYYEGVNDTCGINVKEGIIEWTELDVTTKNGKTTIVAEGKMYDFIANKTDRLKCTINENTSDGLVDGIYEDVMYLKSLL